MLKCRRHRPRLLGRALLCRGSRLGLGGLLGLGAGVSLGALLGLQGLDALLLCAGALGLGRGLWRLLGHHAEGVVVAGGGGENTSVH